MDLSIIRKFCEKRVGGMRKLATDIGMSEQNLHRCVNNNKIQAADLERISRLLQVNISIFFDDDVNGCNAATANNGSIAFAGNNNHGNIGCKSDEILQERVKLLEKLLTEKERLIKILMERK